MEGIYVIYFTGNAGSGNALIVLKGGKITGADAVGGLIDGEYRAVEGQGLGIKVRFQYPAGSWLVTGFEVGPQGHSEEFEAVLPPDFAGGHSIPMSLPTGPVNIIFRMLRGLQ